MGSGVLNIHILEYSAENNSVTTHGVLECTSETLLVDSTRLYVSGYQHLSIFDINIPENPVFLSSVFVDSDKINIYLKDDILYLVCGVDGVVIVDVSNPYNPEIIKVMGDNYMNKQGVAELDNYLYISTTNGAAGGILYVYNNSDTHNPIHIKAVGGLGGTCLVREDNYLYTSFNGLKKIDITERENPILLEEFSLPATAGGIYVGDSLITYSANEYGVYIFKDNHNPVLSVGDDEPVAQTYFLSQNYPNPFNPVTTISFFLPDPSEVTIEIFNLLGERIENLIYNEIMSKGSYQVYWDGSSHPSGVYFYRIETANFSEVKKMVLLR